MAQQDNIDGLSLDWFWPPYLIDLFASQRTLVVGKSYDGAGTVTGIKATSYGIVASFDTGKKTDAKGKEEPKPIVKRMLLTAAGWGWLA